MTFAKVVGIVIDNILRPVEILIFAWATILFLLGVLNLIKNDGDREKAKEHILWAVVGFFVMGAIWGLVNVVQRTFNLDNTPPTITPLGPSSGSPPYYISAP